jgi:catechol 2,3-dioxygenase-like lactoylglutathione lyase family enzyme
MFDHVTIRVSDRAESERFYETLLRVLGIEPSYRGEHLAEWNDFSLAPATPESPATQRLHVGFVAPSREHVDEFWRSGTEVGYRDDGAPGLRPQYADDYYGAFLLDPDGNSAEAVHHGSPRGDGGIIDHLWLRVADVAASKAFYETIATHAGIRLRRDTPTRAQFAGPVGSFSLVAADSPSGSEPQGPTANVHLAFPAGDDATVDAFHAAAVRAGYRDNGAPGERPMYHPGYYGAYVLDPDGNNVEVVHHNRP